MLNGLLLGIEGSYNGSVPVQPLLVASIATHTTCDAMGDMSKAMTCENKASKQARHTHIKSKPLGHMQASHMAEGFYTNQSII